MMPYRIILQKKSPNYLDLIPTLAHFKYWIKQVLNQTLQTKLKQAEIVVRIVDTDESKKLNHAYRNKNYATNVLSFSYELTDTHLIGDIVLCAPIIVQEASKQPSALLSYWAYLTVHGTLHLLGYDHHKTKDAKIMQTLETKLLTEMGFANPWEAD